VKPPLRLLLVCIAATFAASIPTGVASAHSGVQSYVYLSIHDDGLEGRVEFPAADLGRVLGIEFPAAADELLGVAEANDQSIRNYAAEHLTIGDAGSDWPLDFEGVSVLDAAGGYVLVDFTVDRVFDSAPRSFDVTFDGIIHDDPQKDALLIIENDFASATFDNESDFLLGFSAGQETQRVELESGSAWSSVAAVRGLGTDAVREGIVHLLFIVAMVLPVALVATGHRVTGGAPSVATSMRRLGRVFVAYAASHSAVLWLIGLTALDPAARVVGTLVALSLLAVAVHAVVGRADHEVAVIAALAAVQGLGFGFTFLERQLDRSSQLLSLIGFNLGIEVAAVIVVALVVPLLLLIRRTVVAAPALYGGAVAIGAYAVGLTIEQLADVDLGTDRVGNPLRVWPRNLWIMVAATIAAALVAWWAASRGRLRPLVAGAETAAPFPAAPGIPADHDRDPVAS
jgi:HupE / UreJ protein